MQQKLSKNDFENYVKDIKCFKFKRVPNNFLVIHSNEIERVSRKEHKFLNNFKKPVRWNWVRHKRVANLIDNFSPLDDNIDNFNEIDSNDEENTNKTYDLKREFKIKDESKRITNNISPLRNSINYYEKLCKGEDGIYRECKYRAKRATDISELIRGLRDLPRLQPRTDEIHALIGDTVSFDCNTPGTAIEPDEDHYVWNLDKEDDNYDNVIIDNAKVTIKDVEAKNYGRYICSKDNATIRNVSLIVMTLPIFDVVFPSIYSSDVCSYRDLRSMSRLSPLLTRMVCDRYCSVRTTEPVCLRNEMGQPLIRSMVSLKMKLPSNITCGTECKRNLLCSLVLLAVTTVPAIQSIGVVLMLDGFNKTWTPSNIKSQRTVVTHTLRRDSHVSHKYHDLAARMSPGDIDVVVSCPAGYFLVTEQKICVICPANTWAGEGDNTCVPCPHDAESEPGASHCFSADRLSRSCRWRWLLYLYGALACVAVCLATAFSIMLRHHLRQQSNVRYAATFGGGTRGFSRSKKRHSPRRHASAPSRVLLSELLRASSSSTIFNYNDDDYKLWKAKSTPPPLPPIDF